jgi:hypothetical protein
MAYTARSISTIKQQMIDAKNADSNLSGLNSPSQTALWNLYFYVISVCISLFEQMLIVFQNDELEPLIKTVAPNTPLWIQTQMFLFQYSSTNPQYINIVDYVPAYPTVDATLRIITACSVTTSNTGLVTVKLAKSSPFVALASAELAAAKAYLAQITAAGINPLVLSANADELYISGTVYYDAQYPQSVVLANIQAGILAYTQGLNVGGSLTGQTENSDIIAAIIACGGVKDFNPSNIWARVNTVTWSDASVTKCINTGLINNRGYTTFAGYIIPTTTGGYTLADGLTFTAI